MKILKLLLMLLFIPVVACQPAPTSTPEAQASATAIPPTATHTVVPTQTPFVFQDLPLENWVKLRGMPTARSETHAVVLNNEIYVAGGYMNGNPYPSSSAFEKYDPLTNQWTSLKNMPRKLNHLQIAVHGGKMYLEDTRKSIAVNRMALHGYMIPPVIRGLPSRPCPIQEREAWLSRWTIPSM